MKLKSKIIVGFSSVILLLLAVSIMSIIALNGASKGFMGFGQHSLQLSKSSELEADMWIDIHNKVIRTIDYYEQLRESSKKS